MRGPRSRTAKAYDDRVTLLPDFTHIQLSGLWDASPARWQAAIDAACKRADIVTVTESTLLRFHAPHGFVLIHFEGPGRNECSILYRKEMFEETGEDPWCLPVSKTPYALGSGKIRPRIHLLGVELRHRRTSEVVNAEVLHTPSAIEGKGGLVAGVRRTKALTEALAAITAHRKSELRGEASIIGGDWNLDLRKKWVQAFYRSTLRGFRNAWRTLPKSGTHGKRVIDGVRFTKRLRVVGSSAVLAPVAGFDHRMVRTHFRFARR